MKKPKLCRFEGCLEPVANFPNSTIKRNYCHNHFIEYVAEKAKIQVLKEKKKEDVQKKDASRNKSYFEKNLEKIVNEIVRMIDIDKGCISCGCGWNTPTERQFHAGHRISVKSNPTLRFNVFNIYKQCSICNNWESANEREYDKGIIKIYGEEMFEYMKQLPAQYRELHLSIDELKSAILMATKVRKDILSGIDYSREEINDLIGIY